MSTPLDPAIAAIEELKESLSEDSCLKKEPFMKIGSGAAPTLNYNIPQNSCFRTYSTSPVVTGLAPEWFNEYVVAVPVNNYFQAITGLQANELQVRFAEAVQLRRSDEVLFPQAESLRAHLNLDATNFEAVSLGEIASVPVGGTSVVPLVVEKSSAINEVQLANLALSDVKPFLVESMGAFEAKVAYIKEPNAPHPYFFVIEEFTTCSYLGDYGAGRTLNTFSLLPGEKTTISVKTYKDISSTRSYTENILDSYSESSTAELERLIEGEKMDSTALTGSTGMTKTTAWGASLGASVSGKIKGIIDFGVKADGSYSSGTSHSSGFSAGRAASVRQLQQVMNKHVSNSNSNRNIDINTTTTSTENSGEETSIIRELVNYNKSRVLNFVFRQLLQQYVTVTYLSNIKFVYCNGYSESLRVAEVEELQNLLEDVIKPEHLTMVREKLLKPYCSVWNFKDDPIDFIEMVEVDYGPCLGTPSSETFWRIKKNIDDIYTSGGLDIHVPGPILSVNTHTLKTSSVVADAILGQGEALDCYNMKLQDASAIAEQLKNLTTVQQIAVIEEITDPAQRAELYKKVFGNCCDVPQTIVGGCGCADKDNVASE